MKIRSVGECGCRWPKSLCNPERETRNAKLKSMKRVMCLWLPNWPIQRRRARQPDDSGAVVLHSTGRGKIEVVACCREARRQGVRPGMLLAEAQSLGVAMRFEPHDPSAGWNARQARTALQRFLPAIFEPDGRLQPVAFGQTEDVPVAADVP
jgi:hypothetical protein